MQENVLLLGIMMLTNFLIYCLICYFVTLISLQCKLNYTHSKGDFVPRSTKNKTCSSTPLCRPPGGKLPQAEEGHVP